MRAPLEWLSQYITLPDGTTVEQISDALIRIGHEVEAIHTPPPTSGDLVVGQVLTIEELTEFKKPIRFVTLDVGSGHGPAGSDEPRGVICGAQNFAVGDKVAVALPGTVLPGDFIIASRSTYGRISDGMICSAAELGVGTDHDGIIVLDDDAVVGADARSLVGADDTVFELAITPDRGYGLSIRGLARELSAAFEVPAVDVAAGPLRAADPAVPPWPVNIADPTGCDRFVVVRVTGVDPAARSPYWIRRRLQAAGIRSISLAVDVTNYVMVEYGQPLHAFDTATVRGPITVRRAHGGEQLTTLDGVLRTLDPTDLVVADTSGAISLAGVMGGASTEISDTTDDVLIESAHWTPPVISRTARRRGLTSEASRRFERSVDPAIAPAAAERAAELLATYSGGQVAPGRTDVGSPAEPTVVTMPVGETERIVGRPFAAAVSARRLIQVGCAVETSGAGGSEVLLVTPPSWRPDLTRAADLIEEIIRLEGFDTIGSELPLAPAGSGLPSAHRRARAVAAELAAIGLTEVLSFPFVGDKDFDALGLPADDVRRYTSRLLNPLDTQKAQMRTTMLPGLLDTVSRNLARGLRDLAIYEIGLVFLPRPNAPKPPQISVSGRPSDADLAVLEASVPIQVQHVGAVLAGQAEHSGWWGQGRSADWVDIIELARRIGRSAGTELRVVAAENPPWHPGRCASLRVGDWPVGYAGELHPGVTERLGLPARTVALELNLAGFPPRTVTVPPPISTFPPVLLDVALVVDAQVPAATVGRALVRGGGPLLESLRLFDVYTGPPVPNGKKSLAFALTVRAADRTLTGVEAVEVRDAAVAVAVQDSGAVLR